MSKDLRKALLLIACLIAVFALSGCLKSLLRESTDKSESEITEQTDPVITPTPVETEKFTEPSVTTEAQIEPLDADIILFEQSPLGNGYYGLYTVHADGKDLQVLTDNVLDNEFVPAISPDGNKIAFMSDLGGNGYQLYVINPDGTGLKPLTDEGVFVKGLFYSPDSKTIFYHKYVDDLTYIASVNVDGTDPKIVSPGFFYKDYTVFDISPDGTKIAYSSNHEANFTIYLADVDGSNPTSLAHGYNPCFSPDGKKIYYTDGQSIRVMDTDGQNRICLVENLPGADYSVPFILSDGTTIMLTPDLTVPVISPDGTKIMFATDSIYIMNADGSDIKALTEPQLIRYFPSFSPDGTRIAFTYSVDNSPEIFVMNIDGTEVTQLVEREDGSDGFSSMAVFFPTMPS